MKFNLDTIFTDTEFKELKELSKTLDYKPVVPKNTLHIYRYLFSIFKTASETPNKFTDKIKEHFKINLNLQSWYFIEYQEGCICNST